MIPVVWHTRTPGHSNRGYWDQGFAEDIFTAHPVFVHRHGFIELTPEDEGAVVIIPARHFTSEAADIQAGLDRLAWCVLVLTSDEGNEFDHRALSHPRMSTWVQTPHPLIHEGIDGAIPDFAPPGTNQALGRMFPNPPEPFINFSFVGQQNNPRRDECVQALSSRPDGICLVTPAFAQGLPRDAYLAILASCKVAICPSGSFTPDTFRVFEALEAGCMPLVDAASYERGDVGYWKFLFGAEPEFTLVTDWNKAPIDDALASWPTNATRAGVWWSWWTDDFNRRFLDAISTYSGIPIPGPDITVIITTSPIPSHPATDHIQGVVDSIRQRLPDAPIIIACDGIRAEQSHYHDTYSEYLHRLLWLANNVWGNTRLVISPNHIGQALATRMAVERVASPVILCCEHDTPLEGPIDAGGIARVITSGAADLVRLYHESDIHPEHAHLMRGAAEIEGISVIRTVQWSQRPHLASTEYYRRMLAIHFDDHVGMIEDKMHSVAQTEPWEANRMWLYAPDGDMRRSGHTDGRQGDPKWSVG